MTEKELNFILDYYLEDESFEDFLEKFNIDPSEVFILLYREGFLDEDTLECLRNI